MKLLFATKNQHKLHEVQHLLPHITMLSLNDFPDIKEVEETGKTFLENALLKARTIYQKVNIPVLADGSGLEITALDNRPGIFSKRYAGENATDKDRITKVLMELKRVPENQRQARFVCAMVFYDQHKIYQVLGLCHGQIAEKACGNNGFGYDPIFFMPDLNKTMAELSTAEKNTMSHRANALKKINEILEQEYEL